MEPAKPCPELRLAPSGRTGGRLGDRHSPVKCGSSILLDVCARVHRRMVFGLGLAFSKLFMSHEPNSPTVEAMLAEVSSLIVEALSLEVAPSDIEPDAPLFGDGLDLDSIDALELTLVVSKRYGFQMPSDENQVRQAFASLRALTAHIANNRPA